MKSFVEFESPIGNLYLVSESISNSDSYFNLELNSKLDSKLISNLYSKNNSKTENSKISDKLVAIVFENYWGAYKKEHPNISNNLNATLRTTQKQLLEYFSHKRKKFDVPIKLTGTPFQIKAWTQLMKIPYGRTVSYKDQALAIGSAKAVRAIGSANSINQIPIIIPCHRVIASNGNLSGYAGGVHIKKYLLEFENNDLNLTTLS